MSMGCVHVSHSRDRDVDLQTTGSTQARGRTVQSHVKPIKDCPRGAKTDERSVVDDRLSKRLQSSVTISGPCDRGPPVLPVKDGFRTSSIRSPARFWKEKESSDQQNAVKNLSEKSSKVSSKSRDSRRTNTQNQNDKPTRAQKKMVTWSSGNYKVPSKGNQIQNSPSPKNFSQAIGRNGAQKKSAPGQDGHDKIKSRLPVSQSKPSPRYVRQRSEVRKIYSQLATRASRPARISEPAPIPEACSPIYHITCDGTAKDYEESFGMRCPLCNNKLLSLPSDDEYDYYYDDVEPPNFPDVAVLSCGHVFHCDCLVNVTPDELSRDPPCFLCISCTS